MYIANEIIVWERRGWLKQVLVVVKVVQVQYKYLYLVLVDLLNGLCMS